MSNLNRSKGAYVLSACLLVGLGVLGAFLMSDEKEEAPIKKESVKVKEERPEIPLLEEIYFSRPEEEKKEVKKEPPKENKALQTARPFSKGCMPLKGEVTEPFSKGELIKDITMGDWRTHNGIDIKGTGGSEVVAFLKGRVTDVRNDSLWGTVIEIEHPGAVISKYCGLNEDVNVSKGDVVEKGQAIGTLGLIPAETAKGSHLHFEVTERGKYKDPAEMIG